MINLLVPPALVTLGLVLCACSSGTSPDGTSPPEATQEGASGCFLAYDRVTGETHEWLNQSCDVPTSPASTFKIPHALIGLEAGVIPSPDAIRAWDETAHPDAEWGREDQTLITAIRDSVVWYFQEVAQGVGRERMATYLAEFHYGNEAIGDELTEFWLNGSLRISAHQQLDFLRRLAVHELPVSQPNVTSLREILEQPLSELKWRVEDPTHFADAWRSDATIEFKTGTTDHGDGNVSWLVGRLRHQQEDIVFVSRVLDSSAPGARSLAVESALRILATRGLL